jgi:hypothetical protein
MSEEIVMVRRREGLVSIGRKGQSFTKSDWRGRLDLGVYKRSNVSVNVPRWTWPEVLVQRYASVGVEK